LPSTVTTPVGVRLPPVDIERLEDVAREHDTTKSALVAALIRKGLGPVAAS
jgi:hypothetical protein